MPSTAGRDDEVRTAGERWARESLDALRAAHFAPAAWVGFLAASQRRANATRRRRRRDWTRAAGMVAAGAAAWAAPVAAGRERFVRALPRFVAWWALVALMLDWHLGMFETEDGVERAPGPADALTLARAWMVPLAGEEPSAALCVAALVTDGLDGAIARRTAPTRAGRDLEGLVDACFAAAALGALRRKDRLSRAAAGAEGVRLAVSVGYVARNWLVEGRRAAPAVARGARWVAPGRLCGLALASRGHRRSAEGLVVLAAAASAAAHLDRLRTSITR